MGRAPNSHEMTSLFYKLVTNAGRRLPLRAPPKGLVTAAAFLSVPAVIAFRQKVEREDADTADWIDVDACHNNIDDAAAQSAVLVKPIMPEFRSIGRMPAGRSDKPIRMLASDGFDPEEDSSGSGGGFSSPDPYDRPSSSSSSNRSSGFGNARVGGGQWDPWDPAGKGPGRPGRDAPGSAPSSSGSGGRSAVFDESFTKALEEALGSVGGSNSSSGSNSGAGGAGGAGGSGGAGGAGPSSSGSQGQQPKAPRRQEGDWLERQRQFARDIPSHPNVAGYTTIQSLLFANIGVYLAWKVPSPRVRAFLERNFLTSPAHMAAHPRGPLAGWATSLWSSYSHSSFLHLAANMLGLVSFGPGLMDPRVHSVAVPALSVGSFMGMYTAAGFLGSVGSNLFSAACGSSRPALGASGSVFAVITYHTLCHPNSGVLVFFFLHTTAATALGFGTLVNFYLSWKQWRSARLRLPGPAIDGTAHLVGTAIGAAWFWAARRAARASGAPERPTRKRVPRSVPSGSGFDSGHGGGLKVAHPPPGAVDV